MIEKLFLVKFKSIFIPICQVMWTFVTTALPRRDKLPISGRIQRTQLYSETPTELSWNQSKNRNQNRSIIQTNNADSS